MQTRTLLVTALATTLASATGVAAQTPPLSRFVPDLLESAARVDSVRVNDRSDFSVPPQLAGLLSDLNQSIGFQLTTFPFDLGLQSSAPGTHAVAAQFGLAPLSARHVIALGRGKLSMAFNYQNTTFSSLDGAALDSGELSFVLRPPAGSQAQFGRNVLHQSLALRLQRDTATFSLVYGAGDRVDLGVAMPVVHVQMEGQVRSQLFGPIVASPDGYFFDVYPVQPTPTPGCATTAIDVPGVDRAGLPTNQPLEARFDMVELDVREVYRRCTANGLGDIALLGKFRIGPFGPNSLAASVDVRLPTGDADHLLGTGAVRATAALVWSGQFGRFSPHANVGYTHSIGDASSELNEVADVLGPRQLDLDVPHEIAVAVGTDVVLFPRITVAFDVLGRRIDDLPRFSAQSSTAFALSPGDPNVPGSLLVRDGTGANLFVGFAGAQIAVSENVVLKTSVVLPLSDTGLRPKLGAGVGFVYRF